MGDNSKIEYHTEYKVVGNPFFYGCTVKLDSHNYEIRSQMFMMSVVGHQKDHIIEEDEPSIKTGKYTTWKEDNSIVMSWIMNSVQTDIAHTLAYYTTAKHMWTFLRQTCSHDKNVSKILQVEEELLKLQQGELELSQYFALVKAAYERLKALRPPCQACYKTHFEQTMVAKFLAGLSPKYEVAKVHMLTGAEIPDLAEAYNRLNRLAVSLSQPQSESPSAALAVSGGRGQATRGRDSGRGVGGIRRFQCTFCGKLGHLEDRCWDKHGRLVSTFHGRGSSTSGGRGTFSSQIPVGSARAATPLGETPSSMNSENSTVTMSKAEYDQLMAQRSLPTTMSTVASSVMMDSSLSVARWHNVLSYPRKGGCVSLFTACVIIKLIKLSPSPE
ncbi:hypothetical protein EJ110_NYTH33369 [Nymphaea thermarum]|nr:hypothetical protein EJ110_NYTH33369 [Nymphaea thermarum]